MSEFTRAISIPKDTTQYCKACDQDVLTEPVPVILVFGTIEVKAVSWRCVVCGTELNNGEPY